jgi:hypothetical protein
MNKCNDCRFWDNKGKIPKCECNHLIRGEIEIMTSQQILSFTNSHDILIMEPNSLLFHTGANFGCVNWQSKKQREER